MKFIDSTAWLPPFLGATCPNWLGWTCCCPGLEVDDRRPARTVVQRLGRKHDDTARPDYIRSERGVGGRPPGPLTL